MEIFWATRFCRATRLRSPSRGNRLSPPIAVRDYTFWTAGGYLQDDWRTTQRLTMNLGLRYEPMTVPSDKSGRNSGYTNIDKGDVSSCSPTNNPSTCVAQIGPIWKNPTAKNFSPRVGFAWNPLGNGRTSVRGGYGIYYDLGNIGDKLGQQAIMAPPYSNIENILANYGNGIFPPAGPPLVGGSFPFWPFEVPHNVNPANGNCSVANSQLGSLAFYGGGQAGGDAANNAASCLTPSISGSVYNQKTTYIQEYNLTIQQQLPGNIVLTAAYAGSRGIHLRRDGEGNPVEPCNMPNSTTASLPGCTTALPDGTIPASVAWNNGKTPVYNGQLYPGTAPIGNSYRLNPNVTNYVEDHNRRRFLLQRSADRGCQADGAWVAISGCFHLVEGARHYPRRYRKRRRRLQPAHGSLQFQRRQGTHSLRQPKPTYAPTWSTTFPAFIPMRLSPLLGRAGSSPTSYPSKPAIPSHARSNTAKPLPMPKWASKTWAATRSTTAATLSPLRTWRTPRCSIRRRFLIASRRSSCTTRRSGSTRTCLPCPIRRIMRTTFRILPLLPATREIRRAV